MRWFVHAIRSFIQRLLALDSGFAICFAGGRTRRTGYLSLSPSSVILMDVSYPFLPRPEAPISLPPAAAAAAVAVAAGGIVACLVGWIDRMGPTRHFSAPRFDLDARSLAQQARDCSSSTKVTRNFHFRRSPLRSFDPHSTLPPAGYSMQLKMRCRSVTPSFLGGDRQI